ncbi:uncharacterized protein [Penaeus vannamei]|uniref:uncharacterized protein n=1 Tax=Penaeus vannamei TaxID=6689 RepID=UPI00387F769B
MVRGEIRLNLRSIQCSTTEITTITRLTSSSKTKIKEAALEVGGKNDKQSSSKLSVETKQLMQKRRVMKVSSNRDKIKIAERTKTINKKKRKDVRKRNTQIIKETVMSVTDKLFTKVVTARISDSLDSNQPREQAGFRSGFSTTYYVHTLTQNKGENKRI